MQMSPLTPLPSLLVINLLYFPLTISIYSETSFTESVNITKPGCPTKCGNLTVPYPFGIKSSCSINSLFTINCDASYDPPRASIGSDDLEVLGISETKVRVKNRIAWSCYDQIRKDHEFNDFSMDLSHTPFSFATENKLTVVGCDDVAVISRNRTKVIDRDEYISSCIGICSKPEDLSDGFCAGIGCCQASIPKGIHSVYANMGSMNKHVYVYNFTLCGYSFLAEQNSYTFNVSDISDPKFVTKAQKTVPIVLDWAFGNQTCDQVKDTSKIICQGHSVCVDSGSVHGGYRCNCSQGYEGNPYLSPGCQDIDECQLNPCHETAICMNIPGSFVCLCRLNYLGDGMKNGTGCIFLPPPRKLALFEGLPIGLGLVLLMVISFWLYKMMKKRRIRLIKQELFSRNGGLLLQQQMPAHDSVIEKIRIFTSKDLERATDRFNESRILGRGGQGTVYKGMLSDGRIIAVKKSKQVNEYLQEFINEVVILSQVNHRNVVKLLGCCLETEVPILVYEFIPNGTLYHLIHDHDTGIPFTWDLRLRIAAEIANALAYLHYATCIPIYHRDMKSTNILLDEKYRAKLSDFGISRSVAIEQTHLTTKVKGTIGYLDPEYFQTGKFTEKSDVYSFGVVLIELLTGQKPVATSTTDEVRSLIVKFLLSMKENQLKTILDSRILEQSIEDEYIAVCELAKRCLNLNGKKRPTIREVAVELESIRNCEDQSFVESNNQDRSLTETGSFVLTDNSSSWTQDINYIVKNTC